MLRFSSSICLVFSFIVHGESITLMLNESSAPKTLSLIEAMNLAVRQSDSIKKKQAEVRIAEAEASISTSKLLPRVSAKLAHETPPSSADISNDGQVNVGANTTIPLLDVKAIVESKAKRANVAAAKIKLLQEMNQVGYEAASLYIDAAIAQSIADNAQDEQTYSLKQTAAFERKFKAGAARKIDLRRMQYLSAKAQTEVFVKRREFWQALGDLGSKIGVHEQFLLGDEICSHPIW